MPDKVTSRSVKVWYTGAKGHYASLETLAKKAESVKSVAAKFRSDWTGKKIAEKGVAQLTAIENACVSYAAALRAIPAKTDREYARLASEVDTTNVENLPTVLAKVQPTVAKAKEFIKKVEANPTAQEFRDGINKAARDISQNTANIVKATNGGATVQQPDKIKVLNTILVAWGDSGRTVPQDADTAAVQRELNAFRQAVAGLKTWASQQG